MADQVGIYWGTFDPPTFAHLDIISKSIQQFEFSTLCIVVNDNTKTGKKYQSSGNDRAEMLQGMLEEYATEKNLPAEWLTHIQIICQTDANDFSYAQAKLLHSEKHVVAIVGQDSFDKFKQYKASLATYDHILVAPRGDDSTHLQTDIEALGLANISALKTDERCLTISSTRARCAMHENKPQDLEGLLPTSIIRCLGQTLFGKRDSAPTAPAQTPLPNQTNAATSAAQGL